MLGMENHSCKQSEWALMGQTPALSDLFRAVKNLPRNNPGVIGCQTRVLSEPLNFARPVFRLSGGHCFGALTT
jgi:hypothetical protein